MARKSKCIESKLVLASVRGGSLGGMGMTADGYRILFGGDDSFLKLWRWLQNSVNLLKH